jgi:hypothetical protein
MANSPQGNRVINEILNKIVGKDVSKAAIDSTIKNLSRLSTALAGSRAKMRDLAIIGTATTRVIQALGRGAQAVGQSANQAELSQARLDFALAKAGNTSKRARSEMLNYADSLSEVTRFHATALVEAQQLFVTMGGLGVQEAKKATKATADFVELYKGGDGLVEMVRLFSRTLRPGGADVGEFGAKIEVTMTKAQKFAAIMRQIQEISQGAATAVGSTAAGAWAKFANKVLLASSNLGTIIMQSPELQAMMKLVRKGIDDVGLGISDITRLPEEAKRRFDEFFKAVRELVVEVAFAIINLIPLLLKLTAIIINFVRGAIQMFGFLLTELGLAIERFNLFGFTMKNVGRAIKSIGNAFTSLDNVLTKTMGPAQSLTEMFKGNAESANSFWKAGIKLEQMLESGKWSADSLNGALNALRKGVKFLGGNYKQTSTEVRKSTKAFKEQKVEVRGLQNALNNLMVGLFDRAVVPDDAIKQFGTNVRNQLVSQFSDLSLGNLFTFKVEQFDENLGVKKIVDQLGVLGQLTDVMSAPFRVMGEEIAKSTLSLENFGAEGATIATTMEEAFRPVGQVIGSIFKIPMKIIGSLLDATLGWLGRLLTEALVSIGVIDGVQAAATTKQTATALGGLKITTAAATAAAGGLATAWAIPAALSAIATNGASLSFGAAVTGTAGVALAGITSLQSTATVAAGATKAAAARGGVTVSPVVLGNTLVGENPTGQEAIIPLDSDRSLNILRKALGGGSGGVSIGQVDISLSGSFSDPEEAARAIVDEMASQISGLSSLGGLGV